jgi:rare lipoprotein A
MNKPLNPFDKPKFDLMQYVWLVPLIMAFTMLFCFFWITRVGAEEIPTTGLATWYSVASCLKESGQYRMANGRLLDDKAFTAASWYYKFGTKLRVTNTKTQKSVLVVVSDRGPAKRLVRAGKVIDLSQASFQAIGFLKQGVIPVKVEVVQ